MAIKGDIFGEVQRLLGSVAVEDAQARIEVLREEIEERQAEQQRWYSLLGLKQQLGEVEAGLGQPAPPPLRIAIRSLFEDIAPGTPASLSAIRRELQRRDWLGDTDNEGHRLQMAASNMVKRGDLERVSKGLYRLASDDASAGKSSSEAKSSGSLGTGG
jgi:hypothetical protein